MKISIEAGSKDVWKKYINDENLIFGLNKFGKSAPYKNLFNHFELNEKSIFKIIKRKL